LTVKSVRAFFLLLMSTSASTAWGAWNYQEVKDDASAATAYVLQSDSSVAVDGKSGVKHYPFIQLRCDEEGGRAYWRVNWFAIVDASSSGKSSPGIADSVRVEARVDGKEDDGDVWNMNRDRTLEGTTTDRASALVKTLSNATELQLHVSGGYGKAYDATFDVSGLQAALKRLRPHCKKL
jgi:hypothetical protein